MFVFTPVEIHGGAFLSSLSGMETSQAIPVDLDCDFPMAPSIFEGIRELCQTSKNGT
jgi:hypothetical protein